MSRLHANNFATNLTSAVSAGDTTSPLNSIPTIAAPFYLAFDATNINSHYEVVDCTSKTATNVNHAALTYDHTTAEEVRMIVPAVELDAFSAITKATGAEITTGTDDAKFATAKALADAGLNTRLKSKVVTVTRDLTAASGDVSTTGVGFTPTSIIAIGTVGNGFQYSIGMADSAKDSDQIFSYSASQGYMGGGLVCIATTSGDKQTAVVKSYDADGFTLTWTKTNSPTGTGTMYFLCLR